MRLLTHDAKLSGRVQAHLGRVRQTTRRQSEASSCLPNQLSSLFMEKYRSYAEEAREFASRSFREEDRQFWLQIEQSWRGMMQTLETPQAQLAGLRLVA